MNKYPSISASIVTYNSNLEQLKRTIESIDDEFSAIEPKGNSWQIIIVDNNSEKSYRESLLKLVEDFNAGIESGNRIQLSLQPKNNGFGHGHNIAAKLSSADLHLIANPDIYLHQGALTHAISEFRHDKQLSLVLPIIYDGKRNQQSLHYRTPKFSDIILRSIAPQLMKNLLNVRLKQLSNVPIGKKIFRKDNIVFSGCLMLVNKKDLLSIGGFNEDYFLYFEDYDLSLRITQKKAAKICRNFCIDHFGGKTHKKSIGHKIAFLKSYLRFSFSQRRITK